MRKFLLDTGIVLGYARSAGYAEYVDTKFDILRTLLWYRWLAKPKFIRWQFNATGFEQAQTPGRAVTKTSGRRYQS